MKIDVKPIEKSRVHIQIEVPADIVASWRQKAIGLLAGKVKIPGFRVGKATEDVVINYVGEKAVMDETVDLVIQNTYADAVKEKNINVVARPDKVELKSFEPFVYEVVVAVYPEVKLKNYKKLKIPKTKVNITQQEIDEIVEDMQKRFSTSASVTREARMKDKVIVDFEGKDESGVLLDGTKSKDHHLVLGEGRLVPGFEDQVVGMKKGEEKQFDITFPADYHAKHLAGKKVTFTVKVSDVHEVTIPPLESEFFKKVKGREMSKEEFFAEVKKDIEHYKERDEERKREQELMEKLLTVAEVEVPEALVGEELGYMFDDYKNRVESQGIPFDSFLARSGKTEEKLREEWKKDAHDRVAVRLILRSIIEKEQPEVSDEDIEKEISHVLEHYPESEHDKVRSSYQTGSHQREELKNRLQVRKVVEGFLKTE